MYGVPEPDPAQDRNGKKDQNTSFVSDFCHFVDVDLAPSISSDQAVQAFVTIRLGRYDSVNLSKPRPISLTATWLTDSVSNSEFICTANCNVFRSDRKLVAINVTRGGGVLLVVKDHISVQRIDLTSFSNICPSIDLVGCKLTLGYHVLSVFVIYLSRPTESITPRAS